MTTESEPSQTNGSMTGGQLAEGSTLPEPIVRGDDAGAHPFLSASAVEAISRVDNGVLDEVLALGKEFTRFVLQYKFGIDEVTTKIGILNEELSQLHSYNPIEHVTSRVKSHQSIIEKIARRGIEPTFEAIREGITDIAGVRVICSFTSDVYRIAEMLTQQEDVTVREIRDYIANPKPNGYKSLHLLVEIPVFLSTGPVPVIVEVQLRTIAMDFWASLEHKIHYKYDRAVPQRLLDGLKEAADTASQLDAKMEHLHTAIRGVDHTA